MGHDDALTPQARERLAAALRWIDSDERRGNQAALRQFDLGKEHLVYLKILRAAQRDGHHISIRSERPRWMYAQVWPKFGDDGVIKVGVTKRHSRPRVAVERRAKEHFQKLAGTGIDPEPLPLIWWPGSIEAERRLLRKLKTKLAPIFGNEWFPLHSRAVQIVENRSGLTLPIP